LGLVYSDVSPTISVLQGGV